MKTSMVRQKISITSQTSDRREPALLPARDTGLTVGRARRRRRPRRDSSGLTFAILALAVIGLVFAAGALSVDDDGLKPVSTTEGEAAAGAVPDREPTPLLAEYNGVTINLPVAAADITTVGFHQASGNKAVSMRCLVPDHGSESAGGIASAGSAAAASLTVWDGSVHRMWRSNRTGPADTAADVGANAGSPVFAPVTGTVTIVKDYQLYGKYDDVEIHIEPDGLPGLELVLIHVESPTVVPGTRVFAGLTQLASVRRMGDKLNMQLAQYTSNGGDHVHMQLNKIQPGVNGAGQDGS